jgi:hypothetical protein
MPTTEQILWMVGALFIGVVSKIVFDWLKNRNGKSKKFTPINGLNLQIGLTRVEEALLRIEKVLKTAQEDVKWTKEIHNSKGEDGIPRWYVTDTMKKQLAELVKSASRTEEMLRLMLRIHGEGTDPGV